MSPSDSSKRASARAAKAMILFGALAAIWLSSAACQIGDGDCLRMSDCDTGYSCVEGTCISDRPSDAPDASPEAGARSTTRDAAASDAARDGASNDAASDAGADDASSDAS